MKYHKLKIWPDFYKAVVSGKKTFEIRKNDRDFKVGDVVELWEFVPGEEFYTGESTVVKITYVVRGAGFGIQEGFCVFGFVKV